MSNPVALMMLKSIIGPEQIETLETLTKELMRALATIHDMDARMKRLEIHLGVDDETPVHLAFEREVRNG